MSIRKLLSCLIVIFMGGVMCWQAWCLQFLIKVSLLNLDGMHPIGGLLGKGFVTKYLVLASGNGLSGLVLLLFIIMLAVELINKCSIVKRSVQVGCLLIWGAAVASLLHVTSVPIFKMGEQMVVSPVSASRRIGVTQKTLIKSGDDFSSIAGGIIVHS